MLPVESPFKVYTDLNGAPLDNGYVYFGVANQNPITSPITVYWDAAGTQPALQPLRTVNGYITRAGTPANVFVGVSYSEYVKDSAGRQVFYARTSDDFSIVSVVLAFISSLAASAGSSLIGFIQALTGARARTVQDKLRETSVALTDFSTIVADGTDQTAAIVAWLGTLDSAYDGFLEVPYGVKFTADTVYDALPKRAILVDNAARNSWDTAGSRARVITIGAERGDSTSVVDLTTVLASSGHNASTGLDNRGTAGSASAGYLIAAFHWFSGRLKKGQPGMRQLSRWEWKQINGTNKWGFSLIKFVPWLARNWEYWAASTTFAAGSSILTNTGGRTYTTVAGGTTGLVEPTHTSGTAVDGTVTWAYLSTSNDQTIFIVDEYGQVALNTSPLDGVMLNAKASVDSNGAAIMILSAAKASQRAELRLIPTDGAAAEITLIPRLRAENDGSLRLRTSTLLDLFVANEAKGIDLCRNGFVEVTATDGDTTPTVQNCGRLVLLNTGATSITTLDDSYNTQSVELYFANANTTLVYNAGTFILKGAINVTPAANTIIVMVRSSVTAAWVEKSRSF